MSDLQLQSDCQKILKAFRLVTIPEGVVKSQCLTAAQAQAKGLRGSLTALAAFIDHYQDITAQQSGAYAPLIEQLRGGALSDIITNIAISDGNPNDVKAALKMANGRNIMEALRTAVRNIATDHYLEGEEVDTQLGRTPESDEDPNKNKKRNEGTWHESIDEPEKPGLSSREISDIANEGQTSAHITEADITRSAQDGPGEFTPTAEHLGDFQMDEEANVDRDRITNLAAENHEIRAYRNLMNSVVNAYNETLGASFDMGIDTGGKKR